MPALTAKRASSERCAIRRELHRRRKLAAAPKGGIISKDASIQSQSKPPAPSGAATMETSTQETTSRAEHVKKKMPLLDCIYMCIL